MKALNVPSRVVVHRVSVDVVRLSFHVTRKTAAGNALDVHHWDFSNERARELAAAIVGELGKR